MPRDDTGSSFSVRGLLIRSLAAVFFGAALYVAVEFSTDSFSEVLDWQRTLQPYQKVGLVVSSFVGTLLLLYGLVLRLRFEAAHAWFAPPPVLFGAILIAAGLVSSPLGSLPGWTVWVVGPVVVVPFLVQARRTRKPTTAVRGNSELSQRLESITGSEGFEPIDKIAETNDPLARREVVEALKEILLSWNTRSLTVAVEGSWGIGKSTILNHLRRQLGKEGHPVAYFSAWNYRVPARILEAYFEELARLLDADFVTYRKLQALAGQLSEASGLALLRSAHVLLGSQANDPLESTRRELARILENRRVFLLVDDLDRLEAEELVAVLRAIKLVASLPGVSQVLAYDRTHLATALRCQSDEDVRDFMAKVVNLELTVSAPTQALLEMLDERMRASIDATEEDFQELYDSIASLDRRALIRALGTPREVKRLLVSMALKWHHDRRSVNLRDLFLLTLLQYRWPQIHRACREHAELLVAPSWLGDPTYIAHKGEWEKQREQFKETHLPPEMNLPKGILETLFPILVTKPTSGHDKSTSGHDRALRRRLACHPVWLDRYFHQFTPPELFTMVDLEDLVEALKSMEAGESRRAFLQKSIMDLKAADKLGGLLEKADLLGTLALGAMDGRAWESLVEDVVLTVADSSASFDCSEQFLFASELKRASYFALRLTLGLEPERAAALAMRAIKNSQSFAFSDEFLFAAEHPAKRPDANGEIVQLDYKILLKAFVAKISERNQSGQSILGMGRAERDNVLRSLGASPELQKMVLGELKQEPQLLPRLLQSFAPIETSPRAGRIVTERFSPQRLAESIDVNQVRKLTEGTATKSWAEESDRELVKKLRAWDPEDPSDPPSDQSQGEQTES